MSPENKLMAATVNGKGTAFQVGSVKPLFEIRPRLISFQGYVNASYDVTGDGERFLVNTIADEPSGDPLTLLVNWPSLLER